MSSSTAVPTEPRLRRVAAAGPSAAVSQAAENSSYDDFVAASVDDSPRTMDRTNPPSRGNSFASHPAAVSAAGKPASQGEGIAVGGSPMGDSADGPGAFTRDDEFRLKSLQRILSSHSGNPLDPADASQLCAELADLEEKQQVFLRASLARMHADAASAGNLRAGHGGGGAGWGGWLRRAVSTVVGAPGHGGTTSTSAAPRNLKISEPAEQAAAAAAPPPGAGHHKLKIDADVETSVSDAETDATVVQHSPTPADSMGPSPAHRNHHHHHQQQQQHGGGNSNGDGVTSGGDPQPRHHQHQRVNSSGVSTLVRRSVAGRGHDPAWVLVPTPQTPTPGAAATPAEAVSDVEDVTAPVAGAAPSSGWAGEGGASKDDQAETLAVQQQLHRQRLQPGTGGTTGRRSIRQAAAGIVSTWRKDAFGAAAALGVGPVRPVILVTAALLLVTITVAPTDVFTGVGTHAATAALSGTDSAAKRRPADILAALRSHMQHPRDARDGVVGLELKPETAEEFVSRHRHMHSITHLTAAAAALFAGAVLLQPTSAPRRDRIVTIVRVAHAAVGLAFVGLLGDIAVAAVDLHRSRGGLGAGNPVGDVWDAVDACIGTSILLFWYAAVDAAIFAIATSVLQRLGTGVAAKTTSGGDRDGTPVVTPKAATAV